MTSITNTGLENSKEELLSRSEPPEDLTSSSSTQASFRGRLNLAEYTFSSKASSPLLSPRRSPRVSASPKPDPTLKRKASTLSASSSTGKKARSPSGYAPPSKYAHLPELQDVLTENLICVFIGLNPGITTATSGHAYAHPSNLFWKLLHSSGLTPHRRLHPSEDGTLPELYQLGNTNIVSRPTRNGSELAKQEMDDAVEVLEEKIQRYKPEAVCIVGKSIWESIWRVKHKKKITKEEFKYGWQDESENMAIVADGDEDEDGWRGAKVFVATTTSGLAASMGTAEKEGIWKELGDWAQRRRKERATASAHVEGSEDSGPNIAATIG